MSCECYKIGGRFIAEDPDCAVHGYAAQREEKIQSSLNSEVDTCILSIEEELRTGRISSARFYDLVDAIRKLQNSL